MDKNHKFQWGQGVLLEQSPLSIVLSYSELGDHVTLYYKFRIPLSSSWPLSLAVSIDNSTPIYDKISWEEIPELVINDALYWLNKNIEMAKGSRKNNVETILSQIKDKIEKNI